MLNDWKRGMTGAYVDVMVLGQVDSEVQCHAREASLKSLLQVVLLVLLVAVPSVSIVYSEKAEYTTHPPCHSVTTPPSFNAAWWISSSVRFSMSTATSLKLNRGSKADTEATPKSRHNRLDGSMSSRFEVESEDEKTDGNCHEVRGFIRVPLVHNAPRAKPTDATSRMRTEGRRVSM